MLFYFLSVIIILVIGLLIYASTQPNEFRIERSTLIQSPPETIYANLSNFQNWPKWSPWEKLDPEMQRELSGPESGIGAIYAWNGNKKVGKGRMEIIESHAPQTLRIQLDFFEPFPANNMAEFTLQPNAQETTIQGTTIQGTAIQRTVTQQTTIHWAMTGKNTFIGKVMCIFMNMDKFVGKDFEAGLKNLKQLCEATH